MALYENLYALRGNNHSISPVKERFEAGLKRTLNTSYPEDYQFTKIQPEDIELTQEAVYNTQKSVCSDKAVLEAVIEEINAFLGGKGNNEECAAQIQSRISLYMAEHS